MKAQLVLPLLAACYNPPEELKNPSYGPSPNANPPEIQVEEVIENSANACHAALLESEDEVPFNMQAEVMRYPELTFIGDQVWMSDYFYIFNFEDEDPNYFYEHVGVSFGSPNRGQFCFGEVLPQMSERLFAVEVDLTQTACDFEGILDEQRFNAYIFYVEDGVCTQFFTKNGGGKTIFHYVLNGEMYDLDALSIERAD